MTVRDLSKTPPLTDLELYEVIVAAYPEKFGERDELGEDLWDEVMEFIRDELGDEDILCQILGRVVMLTMPSSSSFNKLPRHVLGVVEIKDGTAHMTAAVSRDVVKE